MIECPICGKEREEQGMRRVPFVFAPPTHFLMSCTLFQRSLSESNEWNPFSASLMKKWLRSALSPKARNPVCAACWRIAILMSVAMFILVGGIIFALVRGA